MSTAMGRQKKEKSTMVVRQRPTTRSRRATTNPSRSRRQPCCTTAWVAGRRTVARAPMSAKYDAELTTNAHGAPTLA